MDAVDYAKVIDTSTEFIDDVIQKADDETIGAFCEAAEDLRMYTGWLLGFRDACDLIGIVTPDMKEVYDENKTHADLLAVSIIKTLQELDLI